MLRLNQTPSNMSQQYSLRWNNHQPNFISMFTSLLNTQTLVDVTLAAEGQQLQAHKVVLSACSTYFQSLFVDNPSQHPIVILKDVTFADLRTMVDFMYYGEVNVTEQQLPKVLDTAKHLKIKGLTEMPDTASLLAQGAVSDPHSSVESAESQRHSASPTSPATRRRRRRKSSTGSTSLNMVIGDENRTQEDGGQSMSMAKSETITLSSLPQQRRPRDCHDERNMENMQQTPDPHGLNVDPIIDANTAGMPSEIEVEEISFRKTKPLKRQYRVNPEERFEVRKQISEPTPQCTVRMLQRHGSYPEYESKLLRRQRLTRAVRDASANMVLEVENPVATMQSIPETSTSQRASHTPAVRSGPPLSCNFCWNTVDESGRILRRKTQYHCPECRTNLCIVPCFHEYHEGPEAAAAVSAI